MSPEKLISGLDPNAAPFLFGMVVKIKDFVALKALTIAVTIAFSVGIFYSQTSALISEMGKFNTRLATVEKNQISIQRMQDITNNDIKYIVDDIKNLTAQVGEILSYKAKMRK